MMDTVITTVRMQLEHKKFIKYHNLNASELLRNAVEQEINVREGRNNNIIDFLKKERERVAIQLNETKEQYEKELEIIDKKISNTEKLERKKEKIKQHTIIKEILLGIREKYHLSHPKFIKVRLAKLKLQEEIEITEKQVLEWAAEKTNEAE